MYGIKANPAMELREGDGLLCFYDLSDGHIYISAPDLDSPIGRLQVLFLRSLLSCETNEEVTYFFELLLPRVIAHELAHHYRHRYGLFSNNLWYEEQIANRLATAATKQRLTPQERVKASHFLERAIAGLEEKLEITDRATDSYHSIWQALTIGGQISEVVLGYMELAHELFSIPPSMVLAGGGELTKEMSDRLERREDIIDEVNDEYASNFMRYLYYQLSWLYLDLTSYENQYVELFARQHLQIQSPLLPLLPDITSTPLEDEILAVYRAYQDTHPISKTAGHFFYKRYRSLLLARLQSAELTLPGQAERLRKESAFLLQNWEENNRDNDMLSYLTYLAPPSLRKFFPKQIENQVFNQFPIQLHLPTETERRLWRHIVLEENDQGAANTLARLNMLDQIELYHPLPAEVLLELVYNFCRIKLVPGQVVIWQDELNNDVFILIEGELEVFRTLNDQQHHVCFIQPGEVFGEMAFFTREPRNATVRATTVAECFVIKDTDLNLFVYKYPSILMQMARIVAHRLNQRAIHESTT